jgi:surface antigen
MRPSRTILATALVVAPVAAALGLLGGGPSVAAASTTSLTAPVASAPAVVATAAPAPKHVAAKPKPAATHAPKRVAARSATPRRVATPKRTVSTAPVAPKPVATHKATTTTTTSSARTGNDYPYASATTNASDKWGFTERQCVSFAAWRLARNGHPLDNRTQNWGSALHWDEAARANGVRVSSTPHVGAIAQWNAGEGGSVWVSGGKGHFSAGSYGHVGYVAAVYSDGSVLVEQYNMTGNREYSVMRMTAPRYLF